MVEFMARSIRNELVSKTRVGTQLYAQLEMSASTQDSFLIELVSN